MKTQKGFLILKNNLGDKEQQPRNLALPIVRLGIETISSGNSGVL